MADAIQVDGFRGLSRGLAELGDDLPAKLKQVSKAAAEPVAHLARQLAPYGHAADPRRGHPGALGRSIRTGATTRSATVKAGGRAVPYAGVVHFGGRKKGRNAWRHAISPQPFLFQALDRRRAQTIGLFTDGVAALLDDVDWKD